MSREFFRAAARAGVKTGEAHLAPDLLRFTMTFNGHPELDAVRVRCERYFEGDGFDLFRPLQSDDDELLVLQFPGVIRQQSTPYLLSLARELTDELELDSCEVDASPGWGAEDDLGRAPPESLGGIVWQVCRSSATPPTSMTWSVDKVGARKAWKAHPSQGAGILIGQPDTGVADHKELADSLDIAKGIDIIIGRGSPTDPLDPSMANPGHGTATASVVASRVAGSICGTAPKAKVVPIRCVDAVVLSSGTAVASAIDHARKQGCHVVTMSLGGAFEFPSLKKAIQKAVENEMIVLAAAGNCVKFVVYPAWDPNVIAVAATDERDLAWRGSSVGSAVDISAPGENVYVARRSTVSDVDHALVEHGQGTSFAVTTTAGCAALWLSRHGVAAVKARAHSLGVKTQHLFRAALTQTARRPAGWNISKMGAGVVDAVALLALPLDKIDVEKVVSPRKGKPANLDTPEGFDWKRLGPEATYLAFEAVQRRESSRRGALESAAPPRPSSELAAALAGSSALAAVSPPSPAVIGPATPDQGPIEALRMLVSKTNREEASGTFAEANARKYLAGPGKIEVENALSNAFSATRSVAVVESLKGDVLAQVKGVVEAFANGQLKSPSALSGVARVTAEALVKLTGRPALKIVGGRVDPNDRRVGEWAADLLLAHRAIAPVIAAVGRVDVYYGGEWRHLGTGTHIGGGQILTNRHVMDGLAEVLPGRSDVRCYELTATASIIFDEAASDECARFEITGIICAGPTRIGNSVDNSLLDLAVLRCSPTNSANKQLPDGAACGDFDNLDGLQTIAVTGYPARPDWDQMIDPTTGQYSDAIGDALHAMFGGDYSVKYLSPGELMQIPGQIPDGGHRWVFAHDATSLPGSSGSAIATLGSSPLVAGLHFGGSTLTQNLAHSLAAVRREAKKDLRLLGTESDPFLKSWVALD